MQENPPQNQSPPPTDPSTESESPAEIADTKATDEVASWMSPEMRPTLWRGLAVCSFIIFVSVVIPLLRPPPEPEPEEPEPTVPAKKDESDGGEKPDSPAGTEPAKAPASPPPAR